jgi:predicted ATPase
MATSQSAKMIRARPRLVGLSVEGFKSISARKHLELRGLNVLAGANSAGKSSFAQPLLLLKQTIEASYDPGPLLIDGPNVKFSELRQIFSTIKGRGERFVVGIQTDDGRALEASFGIEDKKLVLVENKHSWISEGKTNEVRLTEKMELNHLRSIAQGNGFLKSLAFADAMPSIVRRGPFLRPQFRLKDSMFEIPASPVDGVGTEIGRNIIHVPGLRGNPERSYKKTAVEAHFPGTLDSYVASIITVWQDTKDPRLDALGKQLAELGLTWKVTSQKLDDTRVELRVGRLPKPLQGGAKDLVSIADVGFGVSQVLPVLVGLLVAEKDQIVYVEQPETHLHPKAQRALAQVFASAVSRGVTVIVETHSLIFVRSIQTLVANDQLSKEEVRLHWVTRNSRGETQVATSALDETGAYGDWPQDFEETGHSVDLEYLEAAERKILASGK